MEPHYRVNVPPPEHSSNRCEHLGGAQTRGCFYMINSLDGQDSEGLEAVSTRPDLADELPASRQSGADGTASEDSEDSTSFDARTRSQDYSDLDPDDGDIKDEEEDEEEGQE